MAQYLLGYDLGSSSVKAALLDAEKGQCVASASSPEIEMPIHSPHPGWAEQDPESWWQELITATKKLQQKYHFKPEEVVAIGISYQMHGLVCVDREGKVLCPSIIWCDSRAVETGQRAFDTLGHEFCLQHYLNSPGNFTASKLKWVMDNQPDVYQKIDKVMLPGDYMAYRLTDCISTTISGLSEGIFWDFSSQSVADKLMDYYGIDKALLADLVPTFGDQGMLSKSAADILGLKPGIPVTYRAGDQPNNAYSLNVLNPGELAATAGTSGVVYGVTDQAKPDMHSRVNTFVHVNNSKQQIRNGVLLCINGTGIAYSWLKKNLSIYSYDDLNALASNIAPGSEELLFLPFGNGAERILKNKDLGAEMYGLDFNRHQQGHLARAIQEGIVFALYYGMEIMKKTGLSLKVIRAGNANMFLSSVFREVFTNVSGAEVELYDTDGAQGAARAAGLGAGFYKDFAESFTGLQKLLSVQPDKTLQTQYRDIYEQWKELLKRG